MPIDAHSVILHHQGREGVFVVEAKNYHVTPSRLNDVARDFAVHHRSSARSRFSALKGGQFLVDDVEQLQRAAFGTSSQNWEVECRFHFGGFARRTRELDTFLADFAVRTP